MRPYVNIKKVIIKDALLEHLNKTMPLLKSLKKLIGILLDGGLSRGYADHNSEIDLLIYLNDEYYNFYINGNLPFHEGIGYINGQLYDISILNYEEEKVNKTDTVGQWDLSYAKILFDTNDQIKEMIKRKLTKVNPDDIGKYLFDVYWYAHLACGIWIEREDNHQGHYVLNQAVTPLLVRFLSLMENTSLMKSGSFI